MKPVASVVHHPFALVAQLGQVALGVSDKVHPSPSVALTARTDGEMMALDMLGND